MTTLKQYATMINQAALVVARKMGLEVAALDKTDRIQARVTTGLIAGLVKLLVDKGLVTDLEVQALLQSYGGDTYVSEPVESPVPNAALPDDQTNLPPDPPPPPGP